MKIIVAMVLVTTLGISARSQSTSNGQFTCVIQENNTYLEGLLRVAISRNDEDCTRQILKAGVRPYGKYQNYEGSEPIRIAALSGTAPGIIDGLFNAGLNPKSDEVTQALFYAAAAGQSKAIERMLLAEVPVNAKSADGETALSFAASSGNLDTVNLLLQRGADPNAKSKAGLTPLMAAGETEPIILALIKRGARINDQDNIGRSALIFAIINSQAKKLEILLENGADPNLRDFRGRTPVQAAIEGKQSIAKQTIIDLLIRYGAVDKR